MRRAENKSHGERILEDLRREYQDNGASSLDSHGMTFENLANYCISNYFCEAQYDTEGRKVAGVRGRAEALGLLKPLIERFGRKQLRAISHGDLVRYRADRLKTKTRRNTTRSIATVNRELSKMRRMLNIAEREGWIIKSPFLKGDSLISVADEQQRERILSRVEEQRLLAACDTPKRNHLRALIIAALDTGARQGELFNLVWDNVDLEARTLRVTSYKGKTVQRRDVPITNRLLIELEKLRATKPDASGDSLVFGITDNVKWSFRAARKEAGLEDVRFHDLRHTAATRLIGLSISLAETGRILGHSNPQTTYRYTNLTVETVKRAGLALDAFNSQTEALETENQTIN
jgi:integrase